MNQRQFNLFNPALIVTFLLSLIVLSSCASTGDSKKQSSVLRHQIAVSLMQADNYPAALKELLSAEEEDPTNYFVQADLGLVYFVREKYELSEKHYLKAISLKPDGADAKNSLARTYIETGRLNKAEVLLNEALADLTYPYYPKVLANLGVLEFKRKNYNKAIVHLKKSLERDRENCYTHTYLGRSYLELQDFNTAITQLDKALIFCSQIDSDEGHYYSAIALYRSNQISRAQTRFEELLKIFPNGEYSEKSNKMLEIIKKARP